MAEDFPDVWSLAGWHGPPPDVEDALWAAWPENSFSRKMRWHEAVLSQHPWEDEEKGFVVEVLWSRGLMNWVPLAHIKPRGGLGETAQTAMARFGPPAPEPGCYVRLPGGPDSPPPKRARVDEAAPAPAPPRRPPPRPPADVPPPPQRPAAVPPPRRQPVAAPRQPPAAAPAAPPPRPAARQPPVVRRAPPPIEKFFVPRPQQEDAERLGEGAHGSLLDDEVKDLPTVPSERAYDVFYYDNDAVPVVRVAPIASGSELQACAARVAQLFMARAQITGPTPRGHDGGAAEYHVAGPSRVNREGDLGKGVTFYGPLRNALGRKGSDPNHRLFHKELEIQLDAARAALAAEVEKVWPDDVGAELDLVARLRRGYEYEGQRASTAASATFGLLNRWHKDKMDEQATQALSWTTVVTLDLRPELGPPEPRRRGRGKRQQPGDAPSQYQFDQFVWDAWRTHVGARVLARPPPAAGMPGGPTWKFVLNHAVTVDLGGPTGDGVMLRFQGAETWHSTFHDATYSRARCLCGLGFYNKSHIIGPLWYRLDKLMREVIVAAGLGVDDLAAYGSNAYEFDTVEDRYFEALHALHPSLEPGTHPCDALAFLARGDAAPAEPVELPERVYDDGEDAVDDMGFDSDGFIE